MEQFLELLPEILQNTYFELNPFNPNNSEEHYQELLRENLFIKLIIPYKKTFLFCLFFNVNRSYCLQML